MRRGIFLALLLCLASPAFAQDRDVLYQLSSMAALKAGVFDGFRTYADVNRHGDFGIGTFENIDGEMIEVDGVVYQVKADGRVCTPGDLALSCYATVTFFDEDVVTLIDEPADYLRLKALLDGILSTIVPNAIRIEGEFERV